MYFQATVNGKKAYCNYFYSTVIGKKHNTSIFIYIGKNKVAVTA